MGPKKNYSTKEIGSKIAGIQKVLSAFKCSFLSDKRLTPLVVIINLIITDEARALMAPKEPSVIASNSGTASTMFDILYIVCQFWGEA